jgi:lipopolysaccharide/colanic/teichoic acid biosynthesis glycosyltransferase
MTSNDSGVWVGESDSRITKVGKFLRATRIDELPQLLNVIKGDMSIIGPRPDIIGLFDDLSSSLPYYTIRNVVKPGLSGWAQTNQEIPPQSLEETKIRLAYDLFYVKNRKLILDVKIVLRTLKTLVSRTGK